MPARQVTTSMVLNGGNIPCVSWRLNQSSQGQQAQFEAQSSLALLAYYGINYIQAAATPGGASVGLSAGYDGASEVLFTGLLDEVEADFETDLVVFRGRDTSAPLADTNALIAGINYRNQTVSQVAQQICDKFGVTAHITASNVMAGQLMWDDHTYTPYRQPWWSMLQALADQAGYLVSSNPDGSITFGPPTQAGSVTLDWGAPPSMAPQYPLLKMCVSYSPRYNSNITVRVSSYQPHTAQYVQATARATPTTPGGPARSRTIKVSRTKSGGIKQRGVATVPGVTHQTFNYTYDGMSPAQAESKAQSIADDLANRQVILKGELEGTTALRVFSGVQLRETQIDLLGLDSLNFSVVDVTHRFSMSEGWRTEFSAMARLQ